MTKNPPTPTHNRPLGVAHLIFGLIFTGLAAIWMIGRASGSDIPDFRIGLPAVLIGAGIIGLAASLLNQRRARARLAIPPAIPLAADEPIVDATAVDLNDDTVITTTAPTLTDQPTTEDHS